MDDSLFDDKSIEERFNFCIDILEKIGIEMNAEFNYATLSNTMEWSDWEMDTLKFSEFKQFLVYLLSLNERPSKEKPYMPICNQLWYLDGERDAQVEYGTLLKRLNLMSGNKFELKDIKNIIDPPFGVRFKMEGQEYEWMFKYNNDWVDFDFLEKVQNLLHIGHRYPNKEYNYYTFAEGQGGVYLYLNKDQAHAIQSFLGMSNIYFTLMGKPFNSTS